MKFKKIRNNFFVPALTLLLIGMGGVTGIFYMKSRELLKYALVDQVVQLSDSA